MSDSVEVVSGFWLPSEFLTDEDFAMDNNNSVTESEFAFPNEFPYHFKQEAAKNAESLWFMSTSPQSTLANMGSPNGGPRTMSFGEKKEDVVSRAASEVAMLKLSGGGGGDRFGVGPNKDTRFMGPYFQHPKNQTPPRQQQQIDNGYGQRQMYGNMGQGGWDPTRLTGSGLGVKRGTGVFLPRPRNSSNISNFRMRQPGGSTTLLPDRAATHASNNGIDIVTGFSRSQMLSQPMFNRGYSQDYDLLMAQRHALMFRQQRSLLLAKRSSMINRETCLPREWTY